MLLSIVIPAFNEEKYIGNTINKINQAIKPKNIKYEIIVCDNNSSDKTSEVALNHNTKVVFEPHNQISKARNTGAKNANGAWLLFIDADTYPEEKLMNEVIHLINSGKYVGCGTTVKIVNGTLFNKLRMERLNPLFRLLNFCGGAFILCDASAFKTIGGFSEDLFAYEEIDFIIKLKKFARKSGKQFLVLHKNPVLTSGRKGDYTFFSLFRLFISNISAAVIFILSRISPKVISRISGRKLVGYWYQAKRS